MKRFFLLLVTLCVCTSILSAQAYRRPTFSVEELQALVKDKNLPLPTVSVKTEAQKYIYAYYGRTDFSTPQWVRVNNFLTWLSRNEPRLNKQFQEILLQWNDLSAERKEVLFGTWLGMKYATDKIGGVPNKSFPILFDQKTWDETCNGYAANGKMYCNKGNFVERLNIGLHETVHLLGGDDLFRERYTVASQQRYGLPVKLTAGWIGGTRTFFPVFESQHNLDLLNEYAEGIDALINYDLIWQQRSTWSNSEKNTPRSLEQRLRSEVFFLLGTSTDEERSVFFFPKANAYFQEVGKEIIANYCNQQAINQKTGFHACWDKNKADILKISAEKLKPLVSKKIPPVPKGYM